MNEKLISKKKPVFPISKDLTNYLIKNGRTVKIPICYDDLLRFQEIKENDPLFIIEAMKMETTVTAIRDCKVKSIMLKEGEMIMQDDLILSVE